MLIEIDEIFMYFYTFQRNNRYSPLAEKIYRDVINLLHVSGMEVLLKYVLFKDLSIFVHILQNQIVFVAFI